jgi:hypothetical protein
LTRICAPLLTLAALPAAATGPIVHHVSVGGPDACGFFANTHPGCNANFSLQAQEWDDGSIRGEYVDRLDHQNGFHAVINCLAVDGNTAWLSGVIVSGTVNGVDVIGRPVATRVQDNGTSARDAVDKISYSWIGDARPCTMKLNYILFPAPDGQVTVR